MKAETGRNLSRVVVRRGRSTDRPMMSLMTHWDTAWTRQHLRRGFGNRATGL